MKSAIGKSEAAYIEKRVYDTYLVLTSGYDAHPAYQWNTNNLAYAHQTAMTWLICGWPTRIVDMNWYAQGTAFDAPKVITHYSALVDVMKKVPDLKKYCNKAVPMFPPAGLTDQEFAAWLIQFSQGTPTWVDPPKT